MESAALPFYSPDMSPCHEIKRTVQRPPFSNFKLPKLGHDLTYPKAELQWPTWASESFPIAGNVSLKPGGLH